MVDHQYSRSHWQETLAANGVTKYIYQDGVLTISLKPNVQNMEYIIRAGTRVLGSGMSLYKTVEDFANDFIYSGKFTTILKIK